MVISLSKFKIYKSDAAPFFFYIDVFPPDTSYLKKDYYVKLIETINHNPIMPLPMRIDRVFNGESSILIRPREAISFKIDDDLMAFINPNPLLQLGIEKLLYFAELSAQKEFFTSLSIDRVNKWWNSTRFLYGDLICLEEDFSVLLKAYLQTMVKAKIHEEDLVKAATEYCQIIVDICNKRIEENSIPINVRGTERHVQMFKVKEIMVRQKRKKFKETQYHPELVDIEVFNLHQNGFIGNDLNAILKDRKPKEKKYIPILFYDDLLECMLQNLADLENDSNDLLNPSFLIDQNVISIQNLKDLEEINASLFSWWSSFDDINLEVILESIKNTYKEYYLTHAKE